MVCPSCKTENDGIKLNGKLFCVSCGEVMENEFEVLEHSYEIKGEQPKSSHTPRRISKEGEDITPKESNLLEAELEVLEEIEKASDNTPAPPQKTSGAVEKKNRERVNIKPDSDFMLVDGEPDPIREPELPPPHDMQVKAPGQIDYEKELAYPLLTRKEQARAHEGTRKKHDALTAFFKSSTEATSKKKAKKKLTHKSKIIITIVILALTLITAFSGLVFYVNTYATDPTKIYERIETKPTFDFSRPKYIPAGFEISHESYSENFELHYFFKYIPDDSESLTISITETSYTNDQLLDSVVKNISGSYSKHPLEKLDVWFVGDNKALFTSNGLLYEINYPGRIGQSEVIKIVEGLI